MIKPIIAILFVGGVVLFAYATNNEPALIIFKAAAAVIFVLLLPLVKKVWSE